MIERKLKHTLSEMLNRSSSVVLVGPRQVGKTTIAYDLVRERGGLYLDLERPSDLTKVSDIENYSELHKDKLIVLDEIQRVPNLFAPLRSIIDTRRREDKRVGLFLLLGSASIDLLKQSSESLAGRVTFCELYPFDVEEVGENQLQQLWYRGGFPDSFLAGDDTSSFSWRVDFIRTYLERDIPQFGPRIPGETLRRFWTMLAHNQGQLFNAAALARGLDVKGITVSRYLDLMVDLLLVRRLQPWMTNTGKRLVKAPKTYIRDSGICHALLGISSLENLLGHPIIGGSWEGFVIENILCNLPAHTQYGYYRSTGGAEIDLVIDFGSNNLWAIEIKLSTAPSISKGFHIACEDINPKRRYVVYSGHDQYPLSKCTQAIGLRQIIREIRGTSSKS